MKKFIGLTFLLTLMLSCSVKKPANKEIKDLTQNWEFTRAGENNWHKATVPGTVHTDLMDDGLIPDPFVGFNEDSLQWIENEDWIYRTTFGTE